MPGHRRRCCNPGETRAGARNGTPGQQTGSPVRYLYVASEGALARLNRADLREVVRAGGWDYRRVGKWLKAETSIQTGRWKNLPKTLYQGDDGEGPWAASNSVAVVSGDDFNDREAAKVAALVLAGKWS